MRVILIALASLTACSAFAGRIRYKPKQVVQCTEACTEEQIKSAVPEAMKVMTTWMRSEKRWEDAKVEKTEIKEIVKDSKNMKVWVITLTDEKAAELSKKTRYLFMTEDGKVLKTNLTGEFK